ncbi:MAG: hypothetical protein ACPGN3_11785 [Opitutales bacterium]
MTDKKRIVFTQGGKGGVGKSEVVFALIPWYHSQGFDPILLDFDIENTNKSGLKNFYPEAEKYDVHAEGALDSFFDICDSDESKVIIADLGSGAGTSTYQWFEEVASEAKSLGIHFTAIGVTNNEAGAVQSVLKWADHLQDDVEYLVVLNALREKDCKFEYWHQEPAVAQFEAAFAPKVISMQARIQEIQSEIRNHTVTLQQIIDRQVDIPYFQKTRILTRAKAYSKELWDGFTSAKDILVP